MKSDEDGRISSSLRFSSSFLSVKPLINFQVSNLMSISKRWIASYTNIRWNVNPSRWITMTEHLFSIFPLKWCEKCNHAETYRQREMKEERQTFYFISSHLIIPKMNFIHFAHSNILWVFALLLCVCSQ